MTNEQNNAVVTTDSQMPCPFCDGQAAVCISSTHRNGTFVYCLSCVASGHDFETKEEAITAWNTRQPETDALEPEIERLRAEAKAHYDRGYYDGYTNLLEQHEAFKQEVSDVMTYIKALYPTLPRNFNRFIIPAPKPDPLVETLKNMDAVMERLEAFRAALEALEIEIREKGQ